MYATRPGLLAVLMHAAVVQRPSAGWFTSDRVLALLGLGLTIAGTAISVWQIVRTRRATVAAVIASEKTRLTLRAADLRRAISISLDVGQRIARTRARQQLATYLGDWLAAYQRIYALLDAQSNLAASVRAVALTALDAARAEIFVAIDATRDRDAWLRYMRSKLLQVLSEYEREFESVLLAIDTVEVGEHAG
jgi:hypothetical protein